MRIVVDYFEKLSLLRYIGFKNGNVTFGNDKIVFYFLPHLVEECRVGTKAIGLEWGAVQFLAGRFAGYQFVKSHGAFLGKELSQVIDISQQTLESFGWGKFSTWRFDKKKMYLLINGERSTLADELKAAYGPQEIPVDSFMAGLFAGAATFYTKTPVYCVELECRVQKNITTCQFVASTMDKIHKYAREFFPSRTRYVKKYLDCVKEVEKKAGDIFLEEH